MASSMSLVLVLVVSFRFCSDPYILGGQHSQMTHFRPRPIITVLMKNRVTDITQFAAFVEASQMLQSVAMLHFIVHKSGI